MSEGGEKRSFGGERPDFSSGMPEGFDPSNISQNKENSGSSKYTLTGEQEEIRIPVGTTVTTSLGVKTNFDALSEGDIIKCSVTKSDDGDEIVTEVWIMEQ